MSKVQTNEIGKVSFPQKGSTESDEISFLGQNMTHAKYEEACRNLEDYFNLLKSWQQGESDES